jgi:hypothetical protein
MLILLGSGPADNNCPPLVSCHHLHKEMLFTGALETPGIYRRVVHAVRCYNPADTTLHNHRYENLKSFFEAALSFFFLSVFRCCNLVVNTRRGALTARDLYIQEGYFENLL